MPATRRYNPARPEPEVLAAQVRHMLEPIFGRRLGPAPAVAGPIINRPAPAAAHELVLA
jgi:hypothetical protein